MCRKIGTARMIAESSSYPRNGGTYGKCRHSFIYSVIILISYGKLQKSGVRYFVG